MKNTLILLLSFLLAIHSLSFGQCSRVIPANANVVSSNQTVNGGFTSQWVCPNDTLFSDGGIFLAFLESNATMVTGGGIDTIYVKNGAKVVMNGGIHVFIHEPSAVFQISGGIPTYIPCASLTFDYSIAPSTGCGPICNLAVACAPSNALCNGNTTGAISVNTANGTGPFSYMVSPTNISGVSSVSAFTIPNLAVGTYSITVTDANGCTSSGSATISEPPALLSTVLELNNVDCFGGNSGYIHIGTIGGTQPYTYSWSNGATDDFPIYLTAGTYTSNVTDANGCSYQLSTTITEPQAITVTITQSGNALSTSISGGTGPYTYGWNTGETTSGIVCQTPGVYSVTVTDVNGCSEMQSFTYSTSGIDELVSGAMHAYPNPVVDELTVVVSEALIGSRYAVLDLTGKHVFEGQLSSESTSIDFAGIPSGMYMIRLESGENVRVVRD